MATYRELLEERQRIEAELESARRNEVADVIARIHELMAEYELTAADLLPKRKRGRPAGTGNAAKAGTALPPKYRDPKTGATWSGRGRAPAWLGKNRKRFLIES